MDQHQTIWYPDGHAGTPADAYTTSTELAGHGAAKHGRTGALGIRAPRDSRIARDIALRARDTDASPATKRYRITNVESKCATTTQVSKVLAAIKWTCEVYNMTWDGETASHFALARAHAPPLNATVR
eukprot:9330300-Pyramimonas_sp.AAC.1